MFRTFRLFAIVLGALILALGVGAILWIIFGVTTILPFHYFFFGPLFGIFFLLFLVFFGLRLIFWPWRYRRYYGRGWRSYDPAMDTLRQRYARGEITKEQFDQMTRDLEQSKWQRRN